MRAGAAWLVLRLSVSRRLHHAARAGATAVDGRASIDGLTASSRDSTADTRAAASGSRKDGRTLYTHGYGAANLEYGVPNTDSTVFESGSVAKQFTAAAIVLLAQDGKLSLDDDIQKILTGGSVLRRTADHDSQSADAHERPARSVGSARHRRTRPGHAGAFADDHARPRRPSENAQLPSGQRVSVQQHGIRARRRSSSQRVSGKSLSEFTRTASSVHSA